MVILITFNFLLLHLVFDNVVSDQTLMASQREPCHESLGLSQQVSRTIVLSKIDGSLMVVKALHSAFGCILPVRTVIMHFFLQISSPREKTQRLFF
jgi:hypothetical protein